MCLNNTPQHIQMPQQRRQDDKSLYFKKSHCHKEVSALESKGVWIYWCLLRWGRQSKQTQSSFLFQACPLEKSNPKLKAEKTENSSRGVGLGGCRLKLENRLQKQPRPVLSGLASWTGPITLVSLRRVLGPGRIHNTCQKGYTVSASWSWR